VRKGDTLGGIADRFSVATEDVRKWNHLKANKVGRGMVLRIYTLDSTTERTERTASHTRSRSKSRKNVARPAAMAQNRRPSQTRN
jgi:LysM repeat protein